MIFIASDHRGYPLKERIKKWLTDWNLEFEDLGNDRLDLEDDYPNFAKKVAAQLGLVSPAVAGEAKGIVICGSGVGVDMVANRFAGVRCGLGFSVEQVKAARNDDDINCLALAADYLSESQAKAIIETFLKTEFSGTEKMKRRIEKIDKL